MSLSALDIYICKNIISRNPRKQRKVTFRSVTSPATVPTAGEVNAALEWLLSRAGLSPGHDLRVSPIPVGLSLMYEVEVPAAAEPALSKGLLAILGYRVPVRSGSFRLYEVEAQLVVGATKHPDVA